MCVKKRLRFAVKKLPMGAEYVGSSFAAFTEYARNARSAGRIVLPDDAVVCAGVLVFDDCAAAKEAKTAGKNDFGVEGRRRNPDNLGIVCDGGTGKERSVAHQNGRFEAGTAQEFCSKQNHRPENEDRNEIE